MVPIVAGLMMGAALGGGIAALQKKDILQGALMGGIGGALGGAFMPGAAAAGAGAAEGATAAGALEATAGTLGSEFGTQGALGAVYNPTAASVNAFEAALPGEAGSLVGYGGQTGVGAMAPTGLQPQGLPSLATVAPTPKPFEISSFLSQNKGALLGGLAGGYLAPNKPEDPADEGNIQTFGFERILNPRRNEPGESYYLDRFNYKGSTPAKDFEPSQFAANGGIVGLAEGGNPQDYRVEAFKPIAVQDFSAVRPVAPAVQAYNQQIMDRANQQYNLNPRPVAMRVPGMDRPAFGMAPVALPPSGNPPGYVTPLPDAGIGGLKFDPITRSYIGDFDAASKKEKTEIEKLREEIDTMRGNMPSYETGGAANGGLMDSYAMGGDIGMRYQSPDDMGMGDRVGAHTTVNMAPHYPMQGMYQGYADGGHLGDYSDGGRLLKGPGDGVSDDIPAQIGARQPARLADGEFVVPARIVSELGNGSTDAGAKRLYAMMDRVQNNRKKSVGKGKVAVDSKAYRHLPA